MNSRKLAAAAVMGATSITGLILVVSNSATAREDARTVADERLQRSALAALVQLPAKRAGDLPPLIGRGLDGATRSLRASVDGPGRVVGKGTSSVTVFRLTDGSYCFADLGGIGCVPDESKLTPHISLGYDPGTKTTRVKVVSLGPDLTDLTFADSQGGKTSVPLTDGIGEVQVPGAGGTLSWQGHGQTFTYVVRGDAIDATLSAE